MDNNLLIAGVLIGCVSIVGFLLWQLSAKKNKPRFTTTPLLTPSEEEMFWRLRVALPDFFIFPKVTVASLLAPKNGKPKNRHSDFKKIAAKMIDFSVHDSSLNLLCIVDLEGRKGSVEADALSDFYFKNAGIKTIRWDAEAKPSAEQISKKILPLASAGKIKRTASKDAPEAMDTVLMMYRDNPEPSNIPGLTFATLDKLTPNKVLLNSYPHIWQRICVFAIEPKHLQKYLVSLSLQDRGEKRAGFSIEALKEIADIRIENDRFLQAPVTGWQPAIVNI